MQNLPDPLPRSLNVGCGFDMRSGFLNVDFAPNTTPDLSADVTHLPMLPDGHFDVIVAQDVLEHFERAKTSVALAEWARLLSPAGAAAAT
jgi:predicted SAM-dependent methyltransferase